MTKHWKIGAMFITAAVGLLSQVVTPARAQNTFPSNGNVGIGTTSPGSHLQVANGHAAVTGTYEWRAYGVGNPGDADTEFVSLYHNGVASEARLEVGRTGSGVARSLGVLMNGVDVMHLNAFGRLGLGTRDPGARFHVSNGHAVIDQTYEWRAYGLGVPGDVNTESVSFYHNGPGSTARIEINRTGDGVVRPLAILMGGVEKFRLDAAGNLHVTGNAQIDGNIAAKYQDVAEWVPATGGILPGTVVILDSRSPNHVIPSFAAYDTRVVGVVSERPGLLLGEAGDDKAKVAHSGRVKVKVDATYGSIAVGDLLVVSPAPGRAMRSEPINIGGATIHRPGTLLGKALEPLSEGQGEILVLLTLQ